MSLAHYLTFFRIAMIPLFPLLYCEAGAWGISLRLVPFLLLFLLSICECTDLLDGFVARKRNQVTDLGKILDPMADSIMRITVLFTFTKDPVHLPLLLVFVFLYREFFISTLRTLCATKGLALAARKSGKIKAILQASVSFMIIILMIPYSYGVLSLSVLQKISFFSVLVCAIYSVCSALEYVYANRKICKKAFGWLSR
jgi:CDP-diacylglycerol--glycerol-3-phosphate 3-phosphatidyltransferase